MRVSEIFHAYQGEGPMIGVPCVFIRLMHCPVGCSWCDTKYTWDGTEKGFEISVNSAVDLAQEILVHAGGRHIVISGGEPLVAKDLHKLIEEIERRNLTFEVETSGVLPPSPIFVKPYFKSFNVSPKPPSAQPKMETTPALLRKWYQAGATVKIVVRDHDDLQWAEALVATCQIPRDEVYLMPEGVTAEVVAEQTRWLHRLAKGFRVSPRVHTMLYGSERAR